MFAHPLGLLALLGVPVVLGLHLFRRRFRPHTVSALFLWVDEVDQALAGRRRERLRSTTSLWLELLAVLLLALAFAGPRGCSGDETPHLIVVLDASASMAAVPPAGSTLDEARALIRERIEALGANARVTLVATGKRPQVLAGPAVLASDALRALAAFTPGATRHELGPALVLARELSAGRGVLLVTDHHAPETLPEGIEAASVGRPADNVGIVHAARTREREAGGIVERAFVTVQAFTRAPVARTLVVEGPTRELARQTLQLEPDRREHLAFPLPEGFPAVRVRLLEADALAVDDAVVLAPEPPRTLVLACTLDTETARELGLSRAENLIGRLLDALPATLPASAERAAHLVLGAAPDDAPEAWSLRLHAGADAGRRDLVGPFLADRRHPLLAGATFEGIVWSIDPDLDLPGAPLVSAGDLPIFTEELDGARRTLHLNLRAARSTLARSPDWPILLSNLAEARRRELPGPAAANVAVGDDFVLRGLPAGEYVARRAQDGFEISTRSVRDVLVFEDVSAPGSYTVVRVGANAGGTASDTAERAPLGVPLARFAAQFQDAAESDLRGRATGATAKGAALARIPSSINSLEALACALVLALLLADWWVLARANTRLGALEPARAAREAGR